MTSDWPPGRTEVDLLEKVKQRAGAIRRRRRIQAATATAAAAVAAVSVSLSAGGGSPHRSLDGSAAGSPSSSVVSVSGASPSPGAAAGAGARAGGAGGPSGSATPGSAAGSASGTGGQTNPTAGGAGPGGTTGAAGHPVFKPQPGSTTGFTPLPESVTPAAGPSSGGTTVVITGIGLENVSTVLFGSVPAKSFHIDTSTRITAVAPAGQIGRVDISAFTSTGQGGYDPLCVRDPHCPSAFTYTFTSPTTVPGG